MHKGETIIQGKSWSVLLENEVTSVKQKFTLFQLLCMFMLWNIGFSSREALIYFVAWRNFLLVFARSMPPCLVKHVINC